MAKTKDFARFLAEQIGGDDALADDIDRERLNGEIAVLIYNERTKAGLTQKELADRAGTHQPVIARLEDAEYDGRTIEVLRRVLRALGCRLSVSAEPAAGMTTVDILPFEPLKVWNPDPSTPLEKKTAAAQS